MLLLMRCFSHGDKPCDKQISDTEYNTTNIEIL
jgi:hypothetical protein